MRRIGVVKAVSSVVPVAVLMFASAVFGGVLGERIHRRADEIIASTRSGGLRPVREHDDADAYDDERQGTDR